MRRRPFHAPTATLFAALAALAFPTTLAAQSCPDAAALTRGFTEPLATIRFLADDALEGRLAGSPGERCAGDYIAARFRALGLRGAAAGGGFFQEVALASAVNPHAMGGTGRNVLAVLPGSDARLRDEFIVIGAHYDHLGRGGRGSLAPDDPNAIHNGADDNASGVAALLRAAALLQQGERPARSVLFIAFTGEESGLLGSAHFTRDAPVPLGAIRAMLNMDMVGRLGSGTLIISGVETAGEWKPLLEAEVQRLGLTAAMGGDGYGPSDHQSFYLQDIPVLHFFTNTHADYHRPSDDWDRIDHAGVERIAQLVAGVSRALARPQTQLTLVRGTGGPPRAPASGSGAWLGTIPDFTPVARGVLLGGVSAGSPGEQAGMKKGDVLIRIGTHDVADLEAFTAALRAFNPGDAVDVVVLRDGREVHLRAVLGRRGG